MAGWGEAEALVEQGMMSFVDSPRVQNGTYTIRNRRTGEHRTFRIRTQRSDAHFAPGKRVLSLLTGPNNTDYKCYTGVAFLDDVGVQVWNKRKGTKFASLAEMFWFCATNAVAPAQLGGHWQDHYEVLCEGTCIRCNRKLTHPESIKTGIGPECGGRR